MLYNNPDLKGSVIEAFVGLMILHYLIKAMTLLLQEGRTQSQREMQLRRSHINRENRPELIQDGVEDECQELLEDGMDAFCEPLGVRVTNKGMPDRRFRYGHYLHDLVTYCVSVGEQIPE